jgi:hypothetical protein
MLLRRAFYYWRFIAVIVLPIWPFVGWGVFGESGWSLLGLFIAMPILAIALLATALLISARSSVRMTKAVTWTDVGLLALWHVTIIGFGFFGPATALWAVLGVAAGLATFWGSIAQLIGETTRRARDTMAEFERQAAGPSTAPPTQRFAPAEDAEIIVIQESKPSDQR